MARAGAGRDQLREEEEVRVPEMAEGRRGGTERREEASTVCPRNNVDIYRYILLSSPLGVFFLLSLSGAVTH
jgi:hypothetical protein